MFFVRLLSGGALAVLAIVFLLLALRASMTGDVSGILAMSGGLAVIAVLASAWWHITRERRQPHASFAPQLFPFKLLFVVFGLQMLVVGIGRAVVSDWLWSFVAIGIAIAAFYQADLTRRSSRPLRGR